MPALSAASRDYLASSALRALPPLDPISEVRPSGRTRAFELIAAEAAIALAPGVEVRAWAWNARVPGPEIRVREGDLCRIRVENRLSQPTSLHWHGLHVPVEMDGVVPLSQEGIRPGQSFTYEFLAGHAGTFLYHSHLHELSQNDLGLYGPFIIEPAEPGRLKHDREYTLVLSGWMVPEEGRQDRHGQASGGAEADGAQKAHGAMGHGRGYNTWTINGKSFPATSDLVVRRGERVRLRLINISDEFHPMHLHGHDLRVIAWDGHPVAQPQLHNTVNVAPGQTVDADFVADNPGRWLFHCHILHHATGADGKPGGLIAVVSYEDSGDPQTE